MEEPGGTLFVSMPSLLDPSLCPEGTHLVHIFTPDWIHNWQVRAVLRRGLQNKYLGLMFTPSEASSLRDRPLSAVVAQLIA